MKNYYTKTVLLLGASLVYIQTNAQDGHLDRSFNKTGISSEITSGGAQGMVVQSDGKIVMTGAIWESTADFGVIRLNSDGSYDTSFGNEGVSTFDFGTYDVPRDLAVQKDGKIVVVGQYKNDSSYESDWAVLRLNSNGSVDSSFGNNGILKFAFDTIKYDDQALSVVIRDNGKIVIGGNGFSDSTGYAVLVQLNSNGTFDDSFGDKGIVFFGPSNFAEAKVIKLQEDGKIVLGGFADTQSNSYDYLVARFNENGTLDNSFATGGYLTFDQKNSINQVNAITIDNNGNIYGTGEAASSANRDIILFKLSSSGTLVSSFGNNGIVLMDHTNTDQTGHGIDLQSDGKIIVVGEHWDGSKSAFILSRFTENGALDNTFGNNGVVLTYSGIYSYAYNVEVLRGDYIMVSGIGGGSGSYFTSARYVGTCPILPASISVQPKDMGVCEGSNVILSVQVDNNSDLQWQIQNNSSFEDLNQADSSSLELKDLGEGFYEMYRVIAYHECGLDDTSSTVGVWVNNINSTIAVSNNKIIVYETGATYQWYKCGNSDSLLTGATDSVFTPSISGNYKVKITKGDCSEESDCYSVVALSTIQLKQVLMASVFPNPTQGEFTVQGENIQSIEVFNLNGQSVAFVQGNQSTSQIVSSSLTKGIYQLKLIDNNGLSIAKLIVQ